MSAITEQPDEILLQRLHAAMAQVNHVLLGKPAQVKRAFTCLIAGGHLLEAGDRVGRGIRGGLGLHGGRSGDRFRWPAR